MGIQSNNNTPRMRGEKEKVEEERENQREKAWIREGWKTMRNMSKMIKWRLMGFYGGVVEGRERVEERERV